MLEVTFYRDSRNRLSSIFATGHADFAEHGQDIVCAGVSTLLQSVRLGLESYARIPLDVRQESGTMRLHWPESTRDDEAVGAIAGSAELAVEQIASQYPEHVKFRRARDEE